MGEKHVPPMPGNQLLWIGLEQDYDKAVSYIPVDEDEAYMANATSSQVAGTSRHKLLIDVDLPAQLIPSTTEGHFHLYIDKEIEAGKYFALLEALADAGIIEPGYLGASKARGFTALRLPWVKKTDDALNPRCIGCGKRPDQLPEYIELAETEGYESPADAVRGEEGTFNPGNGHFYCTSCYILAGAPIGMAK